MEQNRDFGKKKKMKLLKSGIYEVERPKGFAESFPNVIERTIGKSEGKASRNINRPHK